MPVNLKALKEKSKLQKNVQLSRTVNRSGGNGKLSFSIVNNTNSRRCTISKQLSEQLELNGAAELMPILEDGVLMIGKKLPTEDNWVCKLSGEGKKIIYNASVVYTLTELFELDFSDHTSMSFDNISVETDEDGSKIAVVKLR